MENKKKCIVDETSEKVKELSSFDINLFKILSLILTVQHHGNKKKFLIL